MAEDRGEYRAIYVALFDDSGFQGLSPEGRLVLLTLRLTLGSTGIAVVPALMAVLSERTGLPASPDLLHGGGRATTRDAVHELRQAAWIQTEGSVVWIVNALRFEPTLNLNDRKHRLYVSRMYAGLPRLAIRERFRDAYTEWFTEGPPSPSEGSAEALGSRPAPQPAPQPARETSTSAPADYAIRVCRVANKALEQLLVSYKPMVASVEGDVAETWHREGIPVELAEEVVREAVERFKSTKHNRQPHSLAYFDNAVREAFERGRAAAKPTPAEELATMIEQERRGAAA